MKVPLYLVSIPLDFHHVLPSSYKEEGPTHEALVIWEELRAKTEKHGLQLKAIPTLDEWASCWYHPCLKDNSVWAEGPKALELLADFDTAKIVKKVDVDVDPVAVFQQVSSKAEAAFVGGQTVYNNKCDVHMPGSLLASYNEVCLLEDSCSDVLQQKLAAGWRLIAACPQPDQRRPDYILGRFNPAYDGNQSATR